MATDPMAPVGAPLLTEDEYTDVVNRLIDTAVKECKGHQRGAAGILVAAAFNLASDYRGVEDLRKLCNTMTGV